MASKKKKADRTAAIRAAAEKAKTMSREEIATESAYGGLSPQERNLAATRDASLNTGRRAVEVSPVRDIDPSTYVPQQPKRSASPIYGMPDRPAPREAPRAASGPSPAQSRAAAVEQVLQTAKRKKREASAAPKLPSGAKAGPAVEKAAATLVQPSKPKAKPAAKPAPSQAPAAKKAAPKKAAAKTKAVPAKAPPTSPAAPAASPAKKAAPKKAAKPSAAKAAPVKATPASQTAPTAAPAKAPSRAPKKLPRFGGGTMFGLGAMANAAAGFYDSYTREKARKERKGK